MEEIFRIFAGGRISKFFIEKKIFYSPLFYCNTHSLRNWFFTELFLKKTLWWSKFFRIRDIENWIKWTKLSIAKSNFVYAFLKSFACTAFKILKGFQKDNVSFVELTLTNFVLSNAVAIELTLLVEDTNYSLATKRIRIFF